MRFLFVALLYALGPAATPVDAGEPEVTAAELLEHVRKLASDEWEGRGSGSAGERKATEYIAARFAALGLQPAGADGTFFQTVRMWEAFDAGDCRLGSGDVALVHEEEFVPFSATAIGSAEGEAVFAGYGITAPDLGYDDYAGLDVAGRVVFVLRDAPHGTLAWRGRKARRHATFMAKLGEAQKRGAIALVVFNNPWRLRPPQGPRRAARKDVVFRGDLGVEARIPFLSVTLAGARRLVPRLFDATPGQLEELIHAGEKPAPASRASKKRVGVQVRGETRYLHGRNVCALLPAGAAQPLDEVVVLGAHHDHLGRGAPGSLARKPERSQIHNGADDNASGTAGLLEAAEWLAARRERLRRPILFLTFTGEERGLLGSAHWVAHPTLPLDKVAAMVNLDMIGRLEGRALFVGGVKTAPPFTALLRRLGGASGLELIAGDGGRGPSDHASFYGAKVPVLFFFTGLHEDYHRPSDDVERLDVASMEKVARLAAATVEEIANLPERPVWQRADSGGMGPPRPILGVTIDIARGAGQGVPIGGVVPAGPAAVAGILAGDVIVEVAGKPTPDFSALRGALQRRRIGERIEVKVRRNGAERTLSLTLGKG